MDRKPVRVNLALTTFLTAEKVARLADECGVEATLIETRFGAGNQWLNDFEIEGAAGKVDALITKIKEVEIK